MMFWKWLDSVIKRVFRRKSTVSKGGLRIALSVAGVDECVDELNQVIPALENSPLAQPPSADEVPAFVQVHLQAPVCKTFHGCLEHVRFLSLGERWRLAFHLNCDIDQVPRELYHLVKSRKGLVNNG